MTEHNKKVLEFTKLAKQDIPQTPSIPNEKTRSLRAKLILEETLEVLEELGYAPVQQVQLKQIGSIGKIEDLAKELCDLKVVTTGTAISYGFDLDVVQDAVDNNNLDKFGPGHSFRDDGKLIKPPGFKKPNLSESIVSVL